MSTDNAKTLSALGSDYPKRVIPLVVGAQNKIDILMYQWKWYSHESAGGVQKLNLAICRAAKRGVKVRVLLNIESHAHPITRINGRTAGFLEKAGVVIKWGSIGVTTHAKALLIDDDVLVLGSHNFSKGAFTRNQEASIIVKGREAIKDYRRYFDNLWRSFS